VNDLDLNDLRVFVRVVDRGGFAATARELGVPTSTVSRTIARLEASAGTRLLHRTPRSVSATSEGRVIYANVREAVATLEQAARALEPATRKPKGQLKVTAAAEIASAFLADVVVDFAERHPLVQVDLTLTNRRVNLVEEGLDMAVRAAGRLGDSSLVAKKLGPIEHALYASPRYLDRHGTPTSARELAAHGCVVFRAKDLAKIWRLEGDGEMIELPIRARFGGDDFTYLRALTCAGAGIALMPRIVCAKDEAAGRLVRVLPRFKAQGATLYVLYPSASQLPARVRAFSEHVEQAYRLLQP
jgi:DNA-binding transcriptional LysR family regulator